MSSSSSQAYINEAPSTIMPEKDLDTELNGLSVQDVAELANAAHHQTTADDCDEDADAHTELPRTVSRRPSFMRKGALTARGPVRRAQSMRTVRHHPALGSSSGRDVAPSMAMRSSGPIRGVARHGSLSRHSGHGPRRSNSTSHRRMTPGRSVSTDSLGAYRRGDFAANTAIESRPMLEKNRSLHRAYSGESLDSEFSIGDSVVLRKSQLIAEPLDDATYNEQDSYADHESCLGDFSTATDDLACVEYTEFLPDGRQRDDGGDVSFSTLDSLRIRRMQIHQVLDEACDMSFFSRSNSFSTLASADNDLTEDGIPDDLLGEDNYYLDDEEGDEGSQSENYAKVD